MQFVIVRHGSNKTNQPTHRMVLGTLDAPDRQEARSLAESRWGRYASQHFEAIAEEEASEEDWEEAQRSDAES